MIVIGLTGSIGMGKSTTARLLRILKVPVHDSDAEVHKILSTNQDVIKLVRTAFPAVRLLENGGIDRKSLGPLIFGDAQQKERLEKILHPRVRAGQQRFLKRMRRMGQEVAVLDIPLLYETGAYRRVDLVMVVTAPAFIQRQRVLKRPNMSAEKFQAILKAQVPDIEKRRRADIVLQSGLGKAHTMRALKDFLGL